MKSPSHGFRMVTGNRLPPVVLIADPGEDYVLSHVWMQVFADTFVNLATVSEPVFSI
jgi:hypothetical protein